MEPQIVQKPQMMLLGFGFFGDPFGLSAGWTEENEIGRLWKRFMAYLAEQGPQIKHVLSDAVAYEVHIYHAETPQTGEFEVFVGIEVTRLDDMPMEMSAKVLPPATYAVFSLEGQEIAADWPLLINSEWLPEAGYQADHSYSIQRYDERFKGLQRIDESVLDVYIPLAK
jgi:predicted transcriptional regulator YdeE